MFPCCCTADVRFITCCGVIFTSKRYSCSRWGAQLRCFIKLSTPSPRRGLSDMSSIFKFGRSCFNTLLMNSTASDDVTLIRSSNNISSLCVVGMLLSRDSVTSASNTSPRSPLTSITCGGLINGIISISCSTSDLFTQSALIVRTLERPWRFEQQLLLLSSLDSSPFLSLIHIWRCRRRG